MNKNILAETLIDEMLERDWSISDVVVHSGKVTNPEYGIAFLALQIYLITDEHGLRMDDRQIDDLAKAFGCSKELFVNLQQEVIKAGSGGEQRAKPVAEIHAGERVDSAVGKEAGHEQ